MKWFYVAALVAVLCGLAPAMAGAQETQVGLRAGISDNRNEADFRQVDLFAAHPLPWRTGEESRWRLGSRLEGSLGLLWCRQSQAGLVAAFGPALVVDSPARRWQFEIGLSPALLSRHRFAEEDFGGAFQFITHGAILWRFSPGVLVGYRGQHMSNAGLHSKNPGLNLHLIQLALSF